MLEACRIKYAPNAREAAAEAIRVFPGNEPQLDRAPRLEPQGLALLTSKYWGARDRVLTVQFLDTQDLGLRNKILSHMNAWFAGGVCIRFEYTAGQGEVRISRVEDGYWSYLGTDVSLIPANEATMNLEGFTLSTSEGTYNRVVRHETGHTLGFGHEQLRPEIVGKILEGPAIAYFRDTQGWDERTTRRNVLTPLSGIDASPEVDTRSVMCYSLPGFIMSDGVPVEGGGNISAIDQRKANELYPKATVPPPPPPLPPFWCKWFPFLCKGARNAQ